AILEDPLTERAARPLFEDAKRLLQQIVCGRLLRARAVVGFWPAAAAGDDIELYTDESRSSRLGVVHTLRQQMTKAAGRPNLALADYVSPRESGRTDY